MTETRVKISQVVDSQLPNFIKEEFPLVSEFLSQYYLSLEYQSGPSDLFQNIDQYVKVDTLANLTDSTTLSSDITFGDSTISVESTYGFPNSYGLLLIDGEIITYTSKTSTAFQGCIRGFSGVTSYNDPTTPDQLIFTESDSADHTSGSTVSNLSILFLKEFFNKVKKQVSPGFESRKLYSGLNEALFVKQSKDFYSTKGTDNSFKILFRALYGVDVEVIKPRDYLIQPSDAQYRITKDLAVQALSGNPLDLLNKTFYQDQIGSINKAEGTISNVQKINRGSKDYYIISVDYDYDKDITVSGTVTGEFSIHPITQLVTNASIGDTTLDVDSTVGFPSSGELVIDLSNGSSLTVNYTSKSLNQFFGCSGITQTISEKQELRLNVFAYGYSGNTTDDIVKVRITGVLSDLSIPTKNYYYEKNDLIQVKTLGIDLKDPKSNNWFFNISTRYDVKSIALLDQSDYTYRVTLYDPHTFNVGDSIVLISSTNQEFFGSIIEENIDLTSSSNVISFQNTTSFDIKGQGPLNVNLFYTIKKNILKVNSSNHPELNKYSADIQNLYSDLNDSLYVAAPSLPNYINLPISIDDRSITFSGTFEGTDLQIGTHGLYTGDAIVYNPEGESNKLDMLKGIYFVKKVDETTIKLARSKQNIFSENFVSVASTTISNNQFYFYNFSDSNLNLKTVQTQKLIRKLSPAVEDSFDYETLPGTTGIFINGVELLNYKSDDVVYYGEIKTISPTAPGKGYDIVNPPILSIQDNIGSGAAAYCSVIGNLERINIVDPGFDYLQEPVITISGGNGSGAKVKANLIEFDHSAEFNSIASALQVDLSNDTIGFSSYHKFRDSEKVIYSSEGQTDVGGLYSGAFYFVSVQDAYTIKLHKTFDDSAVGINTINLTSYGTGNHKFLSINKKKKIGSISVIDSGSNYQNKKLTASVSGINTASNTIFVREHGLQSGEIVTYDYTETPIEGLSQSSYYVTKVSNDEFKLSELGTGTYSEDFYYKTNQYVNLISTGTGTHIFNYPEIQINIQGSIGVSTLSGQDFNAILEPIFRGKINSVHVSVGGNSYGSEDILNYNRQPLFTLINGSGAQVTPVISNGKIEQVFVVNGGSGYNSIPNLIIDGAGSGASLIPIVSNGSLVDVKVVSKGNGYSSSNTSINVVSAGSEALFEAKIKSWRINIIERLIDSNYITADDGIVHRSLNESYGLQYTHAYSPRKLRSSVLATKYKDGLPIFVPDLQVSSGLEIASDAHSPIIGWAYDGNPIYGPYGYTSPSGGTVRSMVSGYELSLQEGRPSTSLYPVGFFIEDYQFKNSGDLDDHNGRFCVTPEYPNGIYAYFLTINPLAAESVGPFKGYKKPTFPYAIGNLYKSKLIDFNLSKKSNQDDIDINETGWIRNTTPYNLTNNRSYYDYLIDPNKIKKQFSIVKNSTKGGINSIGILTGGRDYQVGDEIIFDNTGSGGQGLIANVSKVSGKEITQVSVANSTLYNVEFVPLANQNYFVGFATLPHLFANNDLVTISSLYDYQKSGNIKVTSNALTLVSGIGSVGYTGLVTYLNVQGNLTFPNIKENDIYQIGSEQVKILNIDTLSSRIKVLRNQNGTTGLTTSSAGIALTEITRKLQLTFGISTSYQFDLNSQIYFDPSESVGLGTTSGPGIGYTLSFTNPGAGITQINIPTRAIYLQNHNLQTGTQLIYSSNGGTPLSVSTNGVSSFSLGEQSIVYATKFTNDLIGISTVKVGLGSTGTYVGIGSTAAALLYFTNVGVGNTHNFKTNYSNILNATVSKNIVTVSTASSHGLQTDDIVTISAKAEGTTTSVVAYDDYNRRLVINPTNFVATNINVDEDTIEIDDHKYFTGQKVIHTSNSPSGGLINEAIYYVVVVDNNKFKLSETYYEATKINPNVVGISSASTGTISLVNPQILLTKNNNLIFDLSDSSLSFTKNSIKYSAFELEFYTDPYFQNIFNSSSSSSSFEVIRTGNVGIDSYAKVILKANDFIPKTLYYRLNPIDLANNLDVKKEIIIDDEILGNSQVVLVDSLYSGTYKIAGISSTQFTYNVLNNPEVSQYNSDEAKLYYSTNSPTAYGPINSISIKSSGRNYQKLPHITKVVSGLGTDAILTVFGDNVGSINKIEIQDIGFDYPSDLSIRATAKLPEVLKIETLSSFKSIGISSVGKNYIIAPNLVVLDAITNEVISDVDLSYKVGDSQVSILKNTKGISSAIPTIIPINNCNGVGISTIKFISSSKDVVVTLGASFSNLSDFPFEIGDRVLIENISVGTASTVKGYNSENYNYALFTIVNIDPNIGGIGATISYNISNYISSSEIPGTYDPVNSYGRIIPEKHFPIFNIELKRNQFFIGENVISSSADGIVQNFDEINGYLKVSTNKDFVIGETIVGESSFTEAKIENIIKFNSVYSTKAFSIVKEGWKRETGFLNNSLQRIHDNDYYQYFSYSLKSAIPFDTWNSAVSDLNHTAGFKKFSDLIIENGDLSSGIATSQDNGDFTGVVDYSSFIDLNCYSDFDLATENNLMLNGNIKSNEIIFNSTIVQDYFESIGNRVLMIDDLSTQFNSSPRTTNFSIVDQFSVDTYGLDTIRFRKYISLVIDRIYTYQRQTSLISLLHDGTFGYLNQYATVYSDTDLGSFDFSISGTQANFLFYPFYSSINNYDVSLASYDLYDSISGIGSVSIGNIAKIQTSTKTISIGSTSASTIVGIASTYRASKVLVLLEASDKSWFGIDELTTIHDGTNVNLLEYGQLSTNNLNPYESAGLGTYSAYISGSNLNIDLTPYSGLSTNFYINALAVSIGSTLSTTAGNQAITDSVLSTSITSIASSTSPTQNLVSTYTNESCAYYIAVVEDTVNNKHQISELMSITNGTDCGLTEFGIVETSSSLGEFSISISGSDTNLYFTPIANVGVTVRVFQHSLNNQHNLTLPSTINLINGEIDSGFGSYEGTDLDVRKSFNLTYKQHPIFERYFDGSNSSIVDVTNNDIKIPSNFFVTGEEIVYSHIGAGSSNAIGITTTTIVGIGTTDKLPEKLYVVKKNDLSIQVAASASEALKSVPSVLTLSSVGIGTSHVFRAKNQNAKSLIAIDNLIQSPIVATSVTTTLSNNVSLSDSLITVSGITSFSGGDLIKIDNEIMRITAVGYGATNVIQIFRPYMGTGISTHGAGSVVYKVLGSYNIVNNVINFVDAPYGKVPFPNPSTRADEQDYVGLETSSTFDGRIFLKSGTPNTVQEPYYRNYIFDDISYNFSGIKTDFILKSNGSDITGISTSNAIVLINNIFQSPARNTAVNISGDYSIKESSGISTISFVGSATSISSKDVNTAAFPRGGVIVSVASTPGFGYQPLVAAGGTATVSIAGTISAISIGNSGSGYRSGVQTVRVGVATSSTGIQNITYIGIASIGTTTNQGRIVSIAITNPGTGFTSTNPPYVIFDSPLSYSNIPLIYSSSSRSGVGTAAYVDIVVGQGSSVTNFEIRNTGYSYGQGEILTFASGGTSGIPTNTSLTFKEFQLTVDQIYNDSFAGWTIGDLQVFDIIDQLFDGQQQAFPLSIDGLQTTIKSKKGSNIDVQATLLVFINDVLQVPGQGYIFTGGSIIRFPEPPKQGDTCKIIFYKGNSEIDVVFVDVLDNIKVGDDLTLYSQNTAFNENQRLVTQIKSSDSVLTNLYSGPGISEDPFLERSVTWCKQSEDMIIDGQQVGKDRVLYEPLIQPTTNIIQSVGISSNVIFVESVKTFFDNSKEYTTIDKLPKKITLISQDIRVAAAATAIVSIAGTISSIAISDGGVGYSTTPSVTIASAVGFGTTQRAAAAATLTGDYVSSISITNPGTGYTTTNPPQVLIESPSPKIEVITNASYEGDFGVITGIKTTSVGVASTGIIFDFFIPKNSFLRDLSVNSVGIATTGVSGIQTGYYFVVSNSNVGRGITSLYQNGSVVGFGSTFIDNIYEVAAVSIAQTSVTGVGLTYVAKVTVSVANYNGLTGLGFSNFYGEYSWGRITNITRSNPKSFTIYNTGLSGISTSPIVQRYNPLKYRNYYT
jgi:hypothetical protein